MSECRICFSAEQRSMISPCKCRGSVQYVHEKCLMTWLKNKYSSSLKALLQRSRSERTGLKCEICKYEFRGKVKFLSLKRIINKIKSSSTTYSVLMNIPIILYLTYKCYYIVRHILWCIYQRDSFLKARQGLISKAVGILRMYLRLMLKVVPLWVYAFAIPLISVSTVKMSLDLYNEFKTIRFENFHV